MHCYDPCEQLFNLEDKIIAINWGKNGDKAVQMTIRKENNGTVTVVEWKELNKD